MAKLTSENLKHLAVNGNNFNHRRRSVDKDHYELPKKNSRHSHHRSVHDRIHTQQTRRSGQLEKVQPANGPRGVVNYDQINFANSKFPKLSEYGVSTVSDKSKESNGFRQTMTKPDRIYFDGRATYYSGRTHVTKKPEFDRTSSRTFNRTLRDRDTFLNVFPNYRIARDHKHSTMRKHFHYPSMAVEGTPTYMIDRTYTKKMDFMKKYTEEMLKVNTLLHLG